MQQTAELSLVSLINTFAPDCNFVYIVVLLMIKPRLLSLKNVCAVVTNSSNLWTFSSTKSTEIII